MASPDEMAASMIANLKEKTGKTLPQWVKVVKAGKLEKHGLIVKHLKSEHGVTHGYANLIAHTALGSASFNAGPDVDLVGAQYAGPKGALRPIYDRIVKEAKKLGKDVEVSPKKAYVSLRRNKQFATIQPSTRTRVDVGLNLKGVAASGRLKTATGMVTHKIEVTDLKGVDTDLKKWLKTAYDAS